VVIASPLSVSACIVCNISGIVITIQHQDVPTEFHLYLLADSQAQRVKTTGGGDVSLIPVGFDRLSETVQRRLQFLSLLVGHFAPPFFALALVVVRFVVASSALAFGGLPIGRLATDFKSDCSITKSRPNFLAGSCPESTS